MKPTLIVFSATERLEVAYGVRDNLLDKFDVQVWKEGFFDDSNAVALFSFLKRLMCYDFAVVILGPDDTRLSKSKDVTKKEYIPRDNVIFELGATMARMGPQKSFILSPNDRKLSLPSYFKGVTTLDYSPFPDRRGNFQSSTGTACASIKRHLRNLSEDAFHSDLPAQGLAYGYFYNFVNSVYQNLRDSQSTLHEGQPVEWDPATGFTITVVIPDGIIGRENANQKLAYVGAYNTDLSLRRVRDVSAYILPRQVSKDPMHILDIPTTLLTAKRVIERIDAFWGSMGDKVFAEELEHREILSFDRKIRALLKENELSEEVVFVQPISEVQSHIENLRNIQPPNLG